MKFLALLFLMLATVLPACTGDCLSCHPSLVPTIQEDPRHRPMLKCIGCHAPDADVMAECGSDCFACHAIEKIEAVGVEPHRVIRGCQSCHTAMEEDRKQLFNPKGESTAPTSLKSLLMDPLIR